MRVDINKTDLLTSNGTINGGSVIVGEYGEFEYRPAAGFIGYDTFNYVVNELDAAGNVLASSTGTVVINVTSDTSAPIAVSDVYAWTKATEARIGATDGVLANDLSLNGMKLWVSAADVAAGEIKTAHGTVKFDVDPTSTDGFGTGGFWYRPDAGFVGVDTFQYTATDMYGQVVSNKGIVAIVVSDNEATINPDYYTTAQNSEPLNVDEEFGLLANDRIASGETLKTVAVTDEKTENGGTYSVETDGSFVYEPAAGFVGTDTFTYEVYTQRGAYAGLGQAIITVTESMAPIAVQDIYTMNSTDSSLSAVYLRNLLANDLSPNGLPLQVYSRYVGTFPTTNGGTVEINKAGDVKYTPADGFTGVDTFSYQVVSYTGTAENPTFQARSKMQNIVFVVNPVAPPVANADVYSMNVTDSKLEVPAEFGVLTNDVATTHGGVLKVNTDKSGGTTFGQGGVLFGEEGEFEYHPAKDFVGVDSFTYVLEEWSQDGKTLYSSTIGTVFVNVGVAVSDPIANNDAYTWNMDVKGHIDATDGVLANDRSLLGKKLWVSAADVAAGEIKTLHGTVTFDLDPTSTDGFGTGGFWYEPDEGFIGTDTFTYTATDEDGCLSGLATVTIVVNGDSAVINPDYYTTQGSAGAAATLLVTDPAYGVLANDSVGSGKALMAMADTGATVNGGTYSIASDGTFQYTPAAGFTGTDTFSYDVYYDSDSNDVADWTYVGKGQAIITVTAFPQAVADTYSVVAGQDLTVTKEEGLLKNDVGVTHVYAAGDNELLEGVPASVTVDTFNGGTVTIYDDGRFVYTPKLGFVGTDVFTYQAMTEKANGTTDLSNWAVVEIIVEATTANQPEAITDLYSVIKGRELLVEDAEFGVLKNDVSKNGLPIHVVVPNTVVESEAGAVVQLNGDGTFTYTPAPGSTFIGLDSFTYQVEDSAGNVSDPAKVYVNVVSGSLVAPQTQTDHYSVVVGKMLAVDDADKGVLANDTSLTGNQLGIVLDPNSAYQTVYTTSGQRVHITEYGTFVVDYAGSNFVGTDMFTYKVTDGLYESLGVGVIEVVDMTSVAPHANTDIFSTEENQTLSITADSLLANDVSPTDSNMAVLTVDSSETNGTINVTRDNSGSVTGITYTPPVDFTGVTTFRYTVSDAQGYTAEAIVVITVNPKVQAAANEDRFWTLENAGPKTLDVLANDYLPYGNWTITDVSGEYGIVTITNNGTMLSYTPVKGWTGTDTFTYTITDSDSGEMLTAQVVVDVNAKPVIETVEDKYNASTGGLLGKLVVTSQRGVLQNDTPVDDTQDPLDELLIYQPTAAITTTGGGTVYWVADSDGAYRGAFTYYSNGMGDTDTFYYRATDAEGNISTKTLVTISVQNQEGTSADDLYEDVVINSTLEVDAADGNGLLANDKMQIGNNLFADAHDLKVEIVQGPQYGKLGYYDADGDFVEWNVGNAFPTDGSFVYQATDDSRVDNFTYRAYTELEDGSIVYGNLAQAWLHMTTVCPEQIDSTIYWTNWQSTELYMDNSGHKLLDNWKVFSGNELSIYDLEQDDVLDGTESVTYNTKEGGEVTIYANGSFQYTPAFDFIGWDSFDYKVTDGWCVVDATARIVVNPVIQVACGGVTISQDDAQLQVIDAKKNSLLKVDMKGDTGITGLKVVSTYRSTTFTVNTSGCYRFFGSDLWLRDGIYLESQATGRSTDKLVVLGSSDADTFLLSNEDFETTNGDDVSDIFNNGTVNGYSVVNGTYIFTDGLEESTYTGSYGADEYYVEGLPVQFTKTTINSGKNEDTLDFSLAEEPVTVNIGKTTAQSVFASQPANKLIMKGNLLGLVGSEYGDTLTGCRGNNTIWGLGGNDVINGGAGNDVIFGGDGDDVIDGGNGNDILFGGDGDDRITDNSGKNILIGDAGEDTLGGGRGSNVLFGGTAAIVDVDGEITETRKAFDAVLAAWNTSKKIDVRADAVMAILGEYLVPDESENTLIGGSSNDLFIVHEGYDVVQNLDAKKDAVRYIGEGATEVMISVSGQLKAKRNVTVAGMVTAWEWTAASWSWEIFAPGNQDDTIAQYTSNKQSFSFRPTFGAGDYLAKLTVTDTDGNEHTIFQTLSVQL